MVNSPKYLHIQWHTLLYDLPKHLVHRLQLAQNCAARLILCGRKHNHITALLEGTALAPRGAEDCS